MAGDQKVPTAIGEPVAQGKRVGGADIEFGKPPVVLQTQPYGFVRLEAPEQLKQWEEDLRNFYGIRMDATAMRGHACETCSCGCSDDCGIM